MLSRILSVSLILLSSMMFAACRGRTHTQYVYVSYGGSWYDVYGHKCAEGRPSPGCNFYSNGSKIRDWEDPYFSAGITLQHVTGYFYKDSYQNPQSYTGWLWISPSGIVYDDFGFALNKSSQTESFDMVANASEQEAQLIQEAAKDLSERHGLPLDTSTNIATSFKKLENTIVKQRSFTEENAREYVTSVYGVSYESALSALTKAKEGNLKELHEMNGEISSYWKVNKETSETILKSWHSQQLEEENLSL